MAGDQQGAHRQVTMAPVCKLKSSHSMAEEPLALF